MARTHLFVGGGLAFGEAVLGLRIADELVARGDKVVVLARDGMSVLTDGRGFTTVPIGVADHKAGIAAFLTKAAKEARASSIVLMDVNLVYTWLAEQGSDAGFVASAPTKVLGLDVWNVAETGLVWDVAGMTRTHSKHSLDVKDRLVPVPLAKPGSARGLYGALPVTPTLSHDERNDVRADLGVAPHERLLVLASAKWQHLGKLPEAGHRLATALPQLVEILTAQLGKDVRVVHVGPEPYPMTSLGARYTWLAQRSPRRFARTLAAADAFLTFNFSATTIGSAIAVGLPVVLGMSSFEGTHESVIPRLPRPPSAALRGWLASTSPLTSFRVCPIGLHRFLTPLTKGNPYVDALSTAELFDEEAFVATTRRLLFDDAARQEARVAQERYRALVAKLPKAPDLVDVYLES